MNKKSLLKNQLMLKVWELQKIQLQIMELRQQIGNNVEPEFETLALTEKESVYFSQNRIVCLTREAKKLMAKHMEALSEMPRVGHSPETKQEIISLAATLRDLANIWEGVAMR
ncbi:hypothetical protein [Gloeomargarita sp.]